jgi:arylsulfatase A-like enzyme
LYGGALLVHYRPHPDSHGAIGCCGSGRPERAEERDADDRRVLQEERYQTYFSGKWHLGDKLEFYPIEHGFDEMKEFAAYYPGVYSYDDTSPTMHPWFPKYNQPFYDEYQKVVNLDEWEGVAGQPARKVARITYDYLADFDVRQADSAVAYIKAHADDDQPFFMDVNFMKMHNPTNPAPPFRGKSKLGNYSDSMLELDANVGRIMDTIRTEAPDTIVIVTCDNGAWQDAWPDAGVTPFRGEKGSPFEGAFRVPGIMWAPGRIPAGVVLDQMMSHMDVWPDRSDGRPHTAADRRMGW